MKIIASLTIIPSRIRYIEPVLQSIIEQSLPPHEIHLQLPEICQKEKEKYTIPSFLNAYPNILVKRHPQDFGSASKWLFPLQYLSENSNLVLIIIDENDRGVDQHN